ncbi:hypothetical protein MXB_3069 [Myxobolus squamalis]|nr:hypothetical protein MXB_3069 [Myxobolus squamalis]
MLTTIDTKPTEKKRGINFCCQRRVVKIPVGLLQGHSAIPLPVYIRMPTSVGTGIFLINGSVGVYLSKNTPNLLARGTPNLEGIGLLLSR